MVAFEVIPAIDLLEGKCVRLAQGDYDRRSVYFDDPADAADHWTEAGARTIHIVDLDGAKRGAPTNLEALRAIRATTAATLQYGGGLRSDEAVDRAIAAGADRVVVGTALLKDPDWVAHLCERFADRIVVGIDARDGLVATEGWLDTSAVTVEQAIDRGNAFGVRRALFTDISRDGMLSGPNLDALRSAAGRASFDVIASGGVARIEDLDAISRTGAVAAIVGRALYTGAVDLRAAIARFLDPVAERASC